MDEGYEHHVELVKAREDAPEAFGPSKEALHLVALAMHDAVITPGVEPVGMGWHHRNESQIQSQLQRGGCAAR